MNEKGFSLVESLCAMGILSIALLGVVPTFHVLMQVDTLSEERSNAVAAAQQVMEGLRQQLPSSLPTSGASAIQNVSVGKRVYAVRALYCTKASYCTADTRHLVLEVSYGGRNVYIVETVYTRLQ
jgi:prepilin-type N-terminal cleavage/methylation domain-containing protein